MKKPWVPLKNRVQSELMKRGHCVGCARSLADAERFPCKDSDIHELVKCECQRVYIYDRQINYYRRATIEEWKRETIVSPK